MSTNNRNSLYTFVNGDNITYFDSIVVEHIPKEIKATEISQQSFSEYKHTFQ